MLVPRHLRTRKTAGRSVEVIEGAIASEPVTGSGGAGTVAEKFLPVEEDEG